MAYTQNNGHTIKNTRKGIQPVTLNANTQASSVLAREVWLTSRLARSRSPSSPQVYTISSHLITPAQTGGEREPERGG